MTREQRAAQIWPILTLCATRRQSLTYDQLARLIGVLRPGLGQLLEPLQSYCILNSLPPLTVLVVSNMTASLDRALLLPSTGASLKELEAKKASISVR